MSSDLPRRNRFSLFGTKRPFFRPLRPFVSLRPRPLFRPTLPPDARSASVCNLISAMRDIALPHISLYISIPCFTVRFAFVRSRRHNILPAAYFSPLPAYVVFPMQRRRTAAHDHICVAPRRIMSYGTGLGPSRTRTFAAREKFLCARPTRKFIFRPTVKLSAPRRTLAALPRVNVTRKTSLRATARPVTARMIARMIKYDDFVKIFIIMY